jgi:hypothetical protein
MIGEIAHIVDQSVQGGPRAGEAVPGGDRDAEANLILLCVEHHTLIDLQPNTYTVDRLVAMKVTHETWAKDYLRPLTVARKEPLITETLHSTLLGVDQIPRHVFLAPCEVGPGEVFSRIRFPRDRRVFLPFVLRAKKLITFADLTDLNGPFAELVKDSGGAERHLVSDWLRDEDMTRWLIALFNQAIGRYLGYRGLRYDKDHKRNYFEPLRAEDGAPTPREERYRPLNQSSSTRQVAWNPMTKLTGKPKRYWVHLAIGLRFIRAAPNSWALSLRPEHRFTTDGFTPLSPKGIGKKATSRKSRMYNADLLTELVFWRSYLTEDQPRLILDVGGQSLIVDGQFMTAAIQWPGVPNDITPFANVEVPDDLFTMAAYADAISIADGDSTLDDLELDDLAVIEAETEEDVVSDEIEGLARQDTDYDPEIEGRDL